MIDDEAGAPPGSDSRRTAVVARGPRAALPWLITLALLLFLGGMLLSPWFEQNVRTRLPGALRAADTNALAVRTERIAGELTALRTRVDALEARPVAIAPIDHSSGEQPALNDPGALAAVTTPSVDPEKVARLDTRVDAIDRRQSQADERVDNLSAEVAGLTVKVENVGNKTAASIEAAARSAERARGVLLVSATRRALDEGRSLAMLAPALTNRFGKDHHEAVARLISRAHDLPTLLDLRQGFARVQPAMVNAANEARNLGWWQEFKRAFAKIVEVRRAGEPSQRDMEAARLRGISVRLGRGDVDGALALFDRLPAGARRPAREWHADAEDYVATYEALRELEAEVLAGDVAEVPAKPADRL